MRARHPKQRLEILNSRSGNCGRKRITEFQYESSYGLREKFDIVNIRLCEYLNVSICYGAKREILTY